MRDIALEGPVRLGSFAMNEMTEQVGLVLPGGGARGAYQAGALSAIAEMSAPGANPFPVIVGQSAGAINAASLASRASDFHQAVAHLVGTWSTLSIPDIYRSDFSSVALRALHWTLMAVTGGRLVGNPRSFLDNDPLRTLLEKEVHFPAIGQAIEDGHLSAVAFTASAYARESGHAVSFFEGRPDLLGWWRSRRYGIRQQLGVDHVMASAALPFVFPAQRISGLYYGDGALRLSAPISPAIRLGARRILVIAARDPGAASAEKHNDAYPSLGSLAGHMLDLIFNDHLDNDIERLERVNATLALMTPEQRADTSLEPVEIFVLRPSQDLREIAGRHAKAMPWTIKALLRGIGGWGGDWRLPSYLNFEGAYCRDLIELGRRDALAHRREIMALLDSRSGGAPATGADHPGSFSDA